MTDAADIIRNSLKTPASLMGGDSYIINIKDVRALLDERDRMRVALADIAAIAWRINDGTDRSEGDRYYLNDMNDWHDLHDALHKHANTIRTVER